MLEFFPMEGEHQVGFVEVPIEFENWLIAVSGISFEDVSLNVLGEEDGEVELIMDYDDYMNLCDLYYEYDTLGWMVLQDPEYVEEINAIPDYEAETFASTDWDEASWAEGFVDDIYAGDGDSEMYLELYINWSNRRNTDVIRRWADDPDQSSGLWHDVYGWWNSRTQERKEELLNIDEDIFVKYYNDALESYGDYEPDLDDSDYDEWGPDDGYEGEGYYRQAETFEAPYAGLGALFNFGNNPSALGGFTAKELTESSAIHGDFDSASLNYSGKQNLEVRQSETFEATPWANRADVEYIILELLTDAQLEEEYGEVMDDYGIGRDDLPQKLEAINYGVRWLDYRTADEAEYLREKYLKEAETFDAHARYNIHRFRYKPTPRHNISETRRKLKQQMWKDTTASVGVKGIAGIIAALAVGVYYWNRK